MRCESTLYMNIQKYIINSHPRTGVILINISVLVTIFGQKTSYFLFNRGWPFSSNRWPYSSVTSPCSYWFWWFFRVKGRFSLMSLYIVFRRLNLEYAICHNTLPWVINTCHSLSDVLHLAKKSSTESSVILSTTLVPSAGDRKSSACTLLIDRSLSISSAIILALSMPLITGVWKILTLLICGKFADNTHNIFCAALRICSIHVGVKLHHSAVFSPMFSSSPCLTKKRALSMYPFSDILVLVNIKNRPPPPDRAQKHPPGEKTPLAHFERTSSSTLLWEEP